MRRAGERRTGTAPGRDSSRRVAGTLQPAARLPAVYPRGGSKPQLGASSFWVASPSHARPQPPQTLRRRSGSCALSASTFGCSSVPGPARRQRAPRLEQVPSPLPLDALPALDQPAPGSPSFLSLINHPVRPHGSRRRCPGRGGNLQKFRLEKQSRWDLRAGRKLGVEGGDGEREFSQRHLPFPAHLPVGAPRPRPPLQFGARPPAGSLGLRPHCPVPAYGPRPGHLPAPTPLVRASQGASRGWQQAKLLEDPRERSKHRSPQPGRRPPPGHWSPGTARSSAPTGFRASPSPWRPRGPGLALRRRCSSFFLAQRASQASRGLRVPATVGAPPAKLFPASGARPGASAPRWAPPRGPRLSLRGGKGWALGSCNWCSPGAGRMEL